MELYVFDRELNFQGILENFFSLRWIRRYHKYGEFELHCSLTPETLNLLKKNNVIWKKDDLEAGYIEYRNMKEDTEGKEIFVVKGKFLTGYLNRRINWGQIIHNGAVVELMKKVINKNAIDPIDPNRKIPRLILDEDIIYTEEISYQNRYGNILEILENISETTEIGFRTKFDYENKRLIFEIYKGLDRTAGQSVNAPAIFSKEFENVLEQEYIDSSNNYRNVALVAGEGEGAARELVTVGQGTGLDRFEMFVDARDLQNTIYEDGEETNIPSEQYREMLKNRGMSKLSEHKEIQTFDSKINLRSNLTYKHDFDLGDIVTCTSKKWGITIDTRITEVEEIYEESGKQIYVVFGNNIPTLVDVIKREVR